MTPTSALSNSFSFLVAFSIGSTIPAGLLLLGLWRDKSRRERRGDQLPVRGKLLRPPGYGLFERMENTREQLDGILLEIVFGGGLAGVGIALYGYFGWLLLLNRISWETIRKHPSALFLASGFLIILYVALHVIRQWVRAWRLVDESRTVRLGLRGEQAVAEALLDRRVLDARCRSFHDVPGEGAWNIDHVVVGPAGVFILETKTRTKRPGPEGEAKHQVRFDGQRLRFPDWDDAKTVPQVLRNAEWIRKFLEGFGPKDLAIQPVIVIPGWYVTSEGNYPVKAMNNTYLSGFLAGQKRRYSDEDLEPLLRRLDERCRTLEF